MSSNPARIGALVLELYREIAGQPGRRELMMARVHAETLSGLLENDYFDVAIARRLIARIRETLSGLQSGTY